MKRFDAAKSLYGDGHLKATRTRECVAMPGKREQVVYTPLSILDPVREMWPEGIKLDPCSSMLPAVGGYREPNGKDKKGKPKFKWIPEVPEPNSLVRAEKVYALELGLDGLALPWEDFTFWNPPYGTLKAWIQKNTREEKETVGLFPSRTHRDWIDLSDFDAVNFLKPLKFHDWKSAAPFPMLLTYNGPLRYEFKEATGHLGKVQTVGWI